MAIGFPRHPCTCEYRRRRRYREERNIELVASALQTRTDFGKPGYGGPCPPQNDHPHRYIDALVPNCELQSDGQNRFLKLANWRYFLRSAAYPFRSSSKVGSNPGHATISNCYSKRRLEQRLNVGGRRYSAGSFRIFAMFSTAVPTFCRAFCITTEFLFVGMAGDAGGSTGDSPARRMAMRPIVRIPPRPTPGRICDIARYFATQPSTVSE